MSGFPGGILGFILGLLPDLSNITNSVIVLGLVVFVLALGFFAISFLGRRQQLLHQERMAAMIKGLHYAGVAKDVFAKPKPDSRDHLLRGMRWMFGAAGLSGALYGYENLQPVPDAVDAAQGLLAGLIPALIGLAHLLFSWICARRSTPPAITSGYYHRAVGRRY
jgi:hypothetical protein